MKFRRLFTNGEYRRDSICFVLISLLFWLFFIQKHEPAMAFDFKDAASISAAYTTHIFLHEIGHQVVADDAGVSSFHMSFFTSQNGKFYPGLSTYKNMPEKSILPYAIGGERIIDTPYGEELPRIC